jgi:hypothetical protein
MRELIQLSNRFELQSYSRFIEMFAYNKVCTVEANDSNSIQQLNKLECFHNIAINDMEMMSSMN